MVERDARGGLATRNGVDANSRVIAEKAGSNRAPWFMLARNGTPIGWRREPRNFELSA